MNSVFTIPVQTLSLSNDAHTSNDINESSNESININVVKEKEDQINSLHAKNKDLVNKLSERRSTVKQLQGKNKQINRKMSTMKRKLELSLENKDEIKRLEKCTSSLEKNNLKNERAQKALTHQKEISSNLKKCNKTLIAHVIKLKKTNDNLTKQLSDTVSKVVETNQQIDSLHVENSELSKSVKELDINNSYMEQLLDDNKQVDLFDESTNSFSTKTMECVMKPSHCNVAHHKIPEVIESVLELADKKPNRLPKRVTIDSMISAKSVVTQKQLSNVLPSKRNLTLYTDETRKFSKTYNTYIVTDEHQSTYFLGLREMYNKSAQTAFETFQTMLKDSNDSVVDSEKNVGDLIVSNIVNTMSDRASTEKAFNNILDSYRKVTNGWADLSEVQQASLTKMHCFFCGLHLLVAFAEVCAKCLNEYEHVKKDESIGLEKDEDIKSEFGNTSESATVRLIRACSKCLSRGGDERSGCFADFQTYLSTIGKPVKFVRFHGNRFNIIFLLAEVLYYHKDDVVAFFEKKHIPTNRLQKAVFMDAKEDILISGCSP